jgi:hypothetical protein
MFGSMPTHIRSENIYCWCKPSCINRIEILKSVIYVTSFVMDQTIGVATEFVHILLTEQVTKNTFPFSFITAMREK